VNRALEAKARALAGIKGYVTNLAACPDATPVTAEFVIGSYHQLFQIERSFRMAKSDPQARPVYHHLRDSIEAHLTIVFAGTSRLSAIEGTSGRRHACRADWFRSRQRQNSVSCPARALPWWKPARAAGGRVDGSIRLTPNALRELLSGKMVSTLLPRARSSSTCAARWMPQSSGARDLPPSGDSTSTRPYPAARSAFSLDR
jgi:hypothetical protein